MNISKTSVGLNSRLSGVELGFTTRWTRTTNITITNKVIISYPLMILFGLRILNKELISKDVQICGLDKT